MLLLSGGGAGMLGALDFASFALCDLCVEVEVRSSEVPWRPRSIVSIIIYIILFIYACIRES